MIQYMNKVPRCAVVARRQLYESSFCTSHRRYTKRLTIIYARTSKSYCMIVNSHRPTDATQLDGRVAWRLAAVWIGYYRESFTLKNTTRRRQVKTAASGDHHKRCSTTNYAVFTRAQTTHVVRSVTRRRHIYMPLTIVNRRITTTHQRTFDLPTRRVRCNLCAIQVRHETGSCGRCRYKGWTRKRRRKEGVDDGLKRSSRREQ